MSSHNSADGWRSLHLLPVGTILIDNDGTAYQVGSRDRHPDETWVNPVSDEYAFVVGDNRSSTYQPTGDLVEVWRPTDA